MLGGVRPVFEPGRDKLGLPRRARDGRRPGGGGAREELDPCRTADEREHARPGDGDEYASKLVLGRLGRSTAVDCVPTEYASGVPGEQYLAQWLY